MSRRVSPRLSAPNLPAVARRLALVAACCLSVFGSTAEARPLPGGRLPAAVPAPPRTPADRVVPSPRPDGSAFDLAGTWWLWVDPGAVGLDDDWPSQLRAGRTPSSAPGLRLRLPVPGPVEALPQTMAYDGVFWLRHAFSLAPDDTPPDARWELRFGRVNYQCRVWLDGVEVGQHEGGYEAFAFPLPSGLTRGAHVLVMRVLDPGALRTDGMSLATTPHAKESWYENFGGVLGPVSLVRLDRPLVQLTWLEPDPERDALTAKVTVVVPPAWPESTLELELTVAELPLGAGWPAGSTGEGLPVAASSRVSLTLAGGEGVATLRAQVPQARHWRPGAPWRYVARTALVESDPAPEGCRPFGFRRVSLDADGLHLDGRTRPPLVGVLYQPHFTGTGGMLPPDDQLQATAEAMREQGFDLLRAHVRPAPPALLDAADRVGLLVLEEPAIGWLDDDPALPDRLRRELDAMLERDHHHPSIVLWGLFNELSGKAYRYGDELLAHVVERDKSRPVLLDSGGFFGRGAYQDAGASGPAPMLDEHVYPPFPLPTEQRQAMLSMGSEQGPAFVSEFGFGALLDATGVYAGFRRRGLRTSEAGLFGGQAKVMEAALASGEGWTHSGWLEESRELQASAAVQMLETLRCNPGLDLACYTQWQAVSSESSAGLLDPWGQPRPASQALSQGMRPLLAVVFPSRSSLTAGSSATASVVLVNRTGRPRRGELRLVLSGARGPEEGETWISLGRRSWPVGVTRMETPALRFDQVGRATLRPLLYAERKVLERGRPAAVAVVPRPPEHAALKLAEQGGPGRELPLTLFDPLGDEAVADFAARRGLPLLSALPPAPAAGDESDSGLARPVVALVSDPVVLGTRVPLPERLALWRFVDSGGALIVLLPDPAASDFGRLVAGARGRLHLVDVPVPLEIAKGAGNFMGRVYPLLEVLGGSPSPVPVLAFSDDDEPGLPSLAPRPVVHAGRPESEARSAVRLLRPDEGELTPVAMLAVGPLGTRLGAVVASVPLGAGAICLVGLPLLAPVEGRPDARRDALLANLVSEMAAESVWRAVRAEPAPARPPVISFTEQEQQLIENGLGALREVVGLADRYSVIHGGSKPLPTAIADTIEHLNRGLLALARGDRGKGLSLLMEALQIGWNDETAAFLALERHVLDGIWQLRSASDEQALRLAHEAIDLWESGVVHWFADEHATAIAWLGRADLLLKESGRVR